MTIDPIGSSVGAVIVASLTLAARRGLEARRSHSRYGHLYRPARRQVLALILPSVPINEFQVRDPTNSSLTPSIRALRTCCSCR